MPDKRFKRYKQIRGIILNKTMLRFTNALVLIGICTLLLTKIINLVLPKIGYVAYQAAATGEYTASNYLIDFRITNLVSILLIIVGLGIGHIVYRKEQGESLFPMPNDLIKKKE